MNNSLFTKIKIQIDAKREECDISTLLITLEDTDGEYLPDNMKIEQEIFCCAGDVELNLKHKSEAGIMYLAKNEVEELIWALKQMKNRME